LLAGALSLPRLHAQEATQNTATVSQANHTLYLPLVARSPGSPVPANPLTVQAVPDTARTVQARIPVEGGSISATAADGTSFLLTVPPDALTFPISVTLTPMQSIGNVPLSGGMLGAVQIEPAELILLEPATLTIDAPDRNTTDDLLTVGFAYDGTGSEFHLRPTEVLSTTQEGVQLQGNRRTATQRIRVFRGYGAGRGTRSDVSRQQRQHPPTDPMAASDQRLVTSISRSAMQQSLADDYAAVVQPPLVSAEANSAYLDHAVQSYGRWLDNVRGLKMEQEFAAQIQAARESIRTAVEHAIEQEYQRCVSYRSIYAGREMQRYLRYLMVYALPYDTSRIEEKIRDCFTFRLEFDSTITHISTTTDGPRQTVVQVRSAVTLVPGTRYWYHTGAAPLQVVRASADFAAGSPCTATFNPVTPIKPFDVYLNIADTFNDVELTVSPGALQAMLDIRCPPAPPQLIPFPLYESDFRYLYEGQQTASGLFDIHHWVIYPPGSNVFAQAIYGRARNVMGGHVIQEQTTYTLRHMPPS
jgi:hypothetical protein